MSRKPPTSADAKSSPSPDEPPISFLDAIRSMIERDGDSLEKDYAIPPLSDAFDGPLRDACEAGREDGSDVRSPGHGRLLALARLRAAMSHARAEIAERTGRSPEKLAEEEREVASFLAILSMDVAGQGGALSLMLQIGAEEIDLLAIDEPVGDYEGIVQRMAETLADAWAGTGLDQIETTWDGIGVAPPPQIAARQLSR